MNRLALAALLSLGLAGCTHKKSDPGEGLPPATDWQAPPPVSGTTGSQPNSHASGWGGSNPHAGIAGAPQGVSGDPHAGIDMNDPHAGVDMNAIEDPQMAALQPPDPNRVIDPKKFLRGTISASKATKDKIKSGAIMFLAVWPINADTGQVLGSPLAVDRIDISTLPVEFELTEMHMMSRGTDFAGDVMIEARVDGDGEARTKEPGDVTGSVRVAIPAKKIELVLDTVLR